MKTPQFLLIAALVAMFALVACDQLNNTQPNPPDVTPPVDSPPVDAPQDEPEPGEPNPPTETFNVLEHAWTLDIPQGIHGFLGPQTIHVDNHGMLYFAAHYFPGEGQCDPPELLPESCQHSRTWLITPDGKQHAIHDNRVPDRHSIGIVTHSVVPAPDGDAYIIGLYDYPPIGFMQRINTEADPVAPSMETPAFQHISTNDDQTIMYGATQTPRGTTVHAIDLNSESGSPTSLWEVKPTNFRFRQFITYNNGEVHLIVSEHVTQPNPERTQFIALDAETGDILHQTILPKSEPLSPELTTRETPITLVVDEHGRTLMYTFTMYQNDEGYIRMPVRVITEIIYDPTTRKVTHNKIELPEGHHFSAVHHRAYPVAAPTGEILVTASTTTMGYVILAIKDSEIQWIHDIHPGDTEPENYHPLAITHHPDYGYYLLGTHRDSNLNLREAEYQVMRLPGML